MRKIINFIVLILFLTTLSPNYLYSDKETNKDDKIKLISGFITGEVADVVFGDLDEMVALECSGDGDAIAKELIATYHMIENSTDIIEKMSFDTKDHGDILEVIIDIKTKNRKKRYEHKIIINKEGYIIWDKTYKDIEDICKNNLSKILSEQEEYVYLRVIEDKLKDALEDKREGLHFIDKNALFLLLEKIKSKIPKVKDNMKLLRIYLKLLQSVSQLIGRGPHAERFEESINKIITSLAEIINPQAPQPSKNKSGKRRRKKKKKKVEVAEAIKQHPLKLYIIGILLNVYSNIGINRDNIDNFEILTNVFIKDIDRFRHYIRRRNFSLLVLTLIDHEKYTDIKSILVSVVRMLKSRVKSSKTILQGKTFAIDMLGKIGAALVARGWNRKADYLVIKYLKDIKIRDAKLKLKVFNNLCLICEEFITNSKYPDKYLDEAESIISFLKQAKKEKNDKQIKRVDELTKFKNKKFKEWKRERNREEQRKKAAKKEIKKRGYRAKPKLKPKQKITIFDKFKGRKKESRVIEPEIKKIAKESRNLSVLNKIKKDKYLYKYYSSYVKSVVEDLRKIKNVKEMRNGPENFVEPMMELEKQLKMLGFKRLNSHLLISGFDKLDKENRILGKYLEDMKSHYDSMERLRKKFKFSAIDTAPLELLPWLTGLIIKSIDRIIKNRQDKLFVNTKGAGGLEKYYKFYFEDILKKRLKRRLKYTNISTPKDNRAVESLKKIIESIGEDYDYEFFIEHTTDIGTLEELKDIGLISIETIDGVEYVVNKAHHWPKIMYRCTSIYGLEAVDKVIRFKNKLRLMKIPGRARLDYILGESNEDIKDIEDKLGKLESWPRDRNEIEAIVNDYKRYKEISGLEIRFSYFSNLIVPEVCKVFNQGYTSILEVGIKQEESNTNIKDTVDRGFSELDRHNSDKNNDSIIIKRVIVTLLEKFSIPEKIIRSIDRSLKDDQEVVFVTRKLSTHKQYKHIKFVEQAKNILGEPIKDYDERSISHVLKMNLIGEVSKLTVINQNQVSVLERLSYTELNENEYLRPEILDKAIISVNIKDTMLDIVHKLCPEEGSYAPGSIGDIRIEQIAFNLDEFSKIMSGKTILDRIVNLTHDDIIDYNYKNEHSETNQVNNVTKILLFLAVEARHEKLVRGLIKKERVCLDIRTKEGKTLFSIAYKMAEKDGDYKIFDILASNIDMSNLYKEDLKKHIETLIKNRERSIKVKYMQEFILCKKIKISIDPIKDLNKLKIARKILETTDSVFKADIAIGDLTLTKKIFKELVFSIYNKLDQTPELEELKALRKAV